METSTGTPENLHCLGCLCSSREYKIQDYRIKYAHFMAIFEVASIKLCYLCKQLAHQAEVFIQNVQRNQILHENCLGDISTTIKEAHLQLEPLKSLSLINVGKISLTGSDSDSIISIRNSTNNRKYRLNSGIITECNSIERLYISKDEVKLNEKCDSDQNGVIENAIKLELKEEDMLEHLEVDFVADEFEDSKEDDFPLKELLQKKLKLNIDASLKRPLRKKKVKNKSRAKRLKLEVQEFEDLDKNVAPEIEMIHITEEECMEERRQLALEEKYLNRTYKCADCIKGYNFKASYVVHLEKHSEAMGRFECDICKLRMDTEEKLTSHKRYHTTRYKCGACGITRISRVTIKDHFAAYHTRGQRLFPCPYCTKCFKRQASQRKHTRYTHVKKERVVCGYCHKSYATKEVLKSHMMTSHPKEVSAHEVARPFACEQCGMTFKSPSHLRNHCTKHSLTRDYYCVECDKAFKTETVLNHHLKTAQPHVNYVELPLSCQHCDKKFAIRRDLERHTNRVHLDIKPYKCDKCDKAYVTNWSLLDHRRHVHDGYKRPLRYPCKMCDKIFDRNSILKAHIRTHTGERPYQCTKCPAQFTQSGVLATHDRLIHLRLTRDGRPKPSGK